MEGEIELKVGTKIKIGKLSSEKCGHKEGEVIELIEGWFEHDNGLYCEDVSEASIWDEEAKDFDSIYHIFGNDLEDFLDCEILNPPQLKEDEKLPRRENRIYRSHNSP